MMKKYEYRVNWGKFWHVDPDYSPFDTFGDDLANLKQRIDAYPNNKLKNCWIERVLYGNSSCTLKSNYEDTLKKMARNKPQEKVVVAKMDETAADQSQTEL